MFFFFFFEDACIAIPFQATYDFTSGSYRRQNSSHLRSLFFLHQKQFIITHSIIKDILKLNPNCLPISGGASRRHPRAGFRVAQTRTRALRGRDGALSHTRVLDLPVPRGEALQVRLGQVGPSAHRQDQGHREVPRGRRHAGAPAHGGDLGPGQVRASASRDRLEDAEATQGGTGCVYAGDLDEPLQKGFLKSRNYFYEIFFLNLTILKLRVLFVVQELKILRRNEFKKSFS